LNLGIVNKSVLIVGASKGIGREIALAFAKEGCKKLVVLARTENLLKTLVTECSEFHQDASFFAVDLMKEDSIKIASKLIDDYGVFDIIIQNIGSSLTPTRNPLSPFSDWNFALRLNAGIAIDLNSVFIPLMVNKNWGRIIHVSSISAKMLRGNPLYASAKSFLNSYVITTGRFLASSGVVLSAVEPGAISFPDSYWDKAMKQNDPKCNDFLRHHQAINRFGTCSEIADVVLFMSSAQSSFMPGAIVPVDGANM
jgi:3-oxoacyl-[acyl-carrier protein] reductase